VYSSGARKPVIARKKLHAPIARAYFFVDEATILRARTRAAAYSCNERTVARAAVIERT
jgi:hypothetical protein